MMDKNIHQVYQKRVIAFVDILGWSEACKSESSRLTAATQVIHDAAESYSLYTKDEIKRMPDTIISPIYSEVQFGAFSDHFAVSMPQNFGIRIISGAADVCRRLLHLGFLTRGGITVGDLHHVDNVIFGPALIEAVQLEKEAVYPRLVCSSSLIDHLETLGHKGWADIVIDHLGRRIANLFVVGAKSTEGQPLDARKIFGITDIEKIVENEIHRYCNDKSDKLAEKWRYMRDILPVMLKCQ